MEDCGNGMSMLLSSIASPFEEDDSFSFPSLSDTVQQECLGSAAQSPLSLLDDFDESACSSLSSPSSIEFDSNVTGETNFSSYDLMMSMMCDDTAATSTGAGEVDTVKEEDKTDEKPVPVGAVRRNVIVRKRRRECTLICWLFRTLLSSEYRALPLNAIIEIFEQMIPYSISGKQWKQSIKSCLTTSAVFVSVLTPNPRKEFLVMNESGSWWTVHPDCEAACAEHVFRVGANHRCPPIASIPAYYNKLRLEKARRQMPASMVGSLNSSPSSSSASSQTSGSMPGSPKRRFLANPATCFAQRYTPLRLATSRPASSSAATTVNQIRGCNNTQVKVPINPMNIMLNEITVDHEEEV